MTNFGEKYSVEDLFDRMRVVSYKTKIIEFYNEIKDKLRSLNIKTSMIMGGKAGVGQIAEPLRLILACRTIPR